jgi:tRNA(fMet)-specific endonuclease VapC
MGRLIDTSILIEAERGRLDIDSHLAKHDTDDSFLSAISVTELLHGVHRANSTEIRSKRSAYVESTFNRFPILAIDTSIARRHARLWVDLEKAGKMIGQHDLWIAATCLVHELSIVTANVREFQRVEGLDVEVWK